MSSLSPSASNAPAPWAPAPGGSRPAAAGGGFTLTDFVRICKQRLFFIVFLSLLGIAVTFGVTLLTQMYFPLYTAETFVQITSLTPPNPNDPMAQAGFRTSDDVDRLLLDQSMLAMNNDIIDETLKDPKVRGTKWYAEADRIYKQDSTRPPADQIKEAIKVTPVRRSTLLQVQASTKLPDDAQTLVNALVQRYYLYCDGQSKTRYSTEQTIMRRRMNDATAALNNLNAQMEKQLSDNPYIRTVMVGGRTPVDDKVLVYNSLITEYSTQAINYKAEWELIQNIGAQNLPPTEQILAAVQSDPYIIELRRQLSQLEQGRQNLLSRFGANHREVRTVDGVIADLKVKFDRAQQDAINRAVLQQREDARRLYATAQNTLSELEEKFQAALAEQRDQETQVKKYREALGNYETLQKDSEGLAKKLGELDAVIARDQRIQVTWNTAKVPQKRSRPDWIVWIPIGVMISLLASVSLALVLDLADTSFRTPRDLVLHASLAVLGAIPNADDDEVDIQRVESATIDAPQSIVAEAFRQMRTNLFFAAPAEQQGILLVTSGSAGEGKTTVAANLAAAVALGGRRVLLIDANFRRPSLRGIFTSAKVDGLSNVLIGQSRAADVIAPTGVPGLDVMTAGPIPPNPAELLGGPYLKNMLAEVRKNYDQIIFDAPPLLVVSDALVLSRVVDGVIVVSRFRQTSRGALIRARGLLEGINARILGAVLNAVESTRGGYFRKQYREFYDYQAENEAGGVAKLPRPSTSQQSLEKDA